jgi:hypothetical protein
MPGRELCHGLQLLRVIKFMVSETLSNIHIVMPVEQSDDKFAMENSDSVSVSYIFDISSHQNIDAIFLSIFSNKNSQPFSLTISSDKQFQDNYFWFEKLCLILCHPSYIRVDNKQLIVVNCEETFVKELEKELQNQGFFDLLFVYIFQNKTPSFAYYNKNILVEEDFYKWYIQVLINNLSPPNIFINLKNYESINSFLELRRKTEEKFRSTEPQTYKLIKQVFLKSKEINQQNSLINRLKEDLSSKEVYLDFILGKFKQSENDEDLTLNDIMKIKKFYHYEYEILPTWYKRFGHIIKVIIGKRTFRSLFNDNVKKYKD